jgi:hypothetical protein
MNRYQAECYALDLHTLKELHSELGEGTTN